MHRNSHHWGNQPKPAREPLPNLDGPSGSERVILISNFYEFQVHSRFCTDQNQGIKLQQYKVTTTPKIEKEKFRKIRQQIFEKQVQRREQQTEIKEQLEEASQVQEAQEAQVPDAKEEIIQDEEPIVIDLRELLGQSCTFFNDVETYSPYSLYSLRSPIENEKLEFTWTLSDGKKFPVAITHERELDPVKDALVYKDFFSTYFFSQIVLKSFPHYKYVGKRVLYSPVDRVINLKEHDIEIWSGFKWQIHTEVNRGVQQISNNDNLGAFPFVNIDVDYLVVRLETALDVIKEVRKTLLEQEKVETSVITESMSGFGNIEQQQREARQSKNNDMVRKEIRKALTGKAVVTRYNNQIYYVKDIEFTQTPESTFIQTTYTQDEGGQTKKKQVKRTFSEYLEERYYKTVTDKSQPLLITTSGISLVPEFCMLTGLNEEIMNSSSKFNLIRDVINVIKPEVQRRILDIKRDFFDKLQLDPNADITVGNIPHVLEGVKLEHPLLQMAKLPQGPRVEIQTNRIEDLEKRIFQAQPLKMFEAPPLETWCLFCLENEENLAKKFIQTMQESLVTFNYHAKEIKLIKVKSNKHQDWLDSLKGNLNTQVIACILILPGVKGVPNSLYTQVKRLLIQEIAVPSQVVLSSTIERSKNALFSICNKLLVHLCAKIGGEPWAVNELPFFYSCTMAVGFYVFDNLISFVCSLNPKATKYWSKSLPLFDEGETDESFRAQQRSSRIQSKLQSLLFEAFLAFKLRINAYPTYLFVFTNSRVKDNSQIEIDAMQTIHNSAIFFQIKYTQVQLYYVQNFQEQGLWNACKNANLHQIHLPLSGPLNQAYSPLWPR